jgi:hypothetical protein
VVSVRLRLHFTAGERTYGAHWIGGWIGLRAGLDTEVRKKFFASVGDRYVNSVVEKALLHKIANKYVLIIAN